MNQCEYFYGAMGAGLEVMAGVLIGVLATVVLGALPKNNDQQSPDDRKCPKGF